MHKRDVRNYYYVCPTCLSVPENCSCSLLPETLMQIDKRMLPIIRELNKKWYVTTSCCEGHVGHYEQIYIMFKSKHKFKLPLPKGFEGNGSYLKSPITGTTEEAKKRKKRQLLNSLYLWACELESLGPNMLIK